MQKGSILDLAFIVVLLFTIFLSVPLFTNMLGKIATETASNTQLNETRFSQNITGLKGTVEGVIDASFVLLSGALILIVLTTSAVVFSSPIFFFMGLLLMFIVIVFSMGISNASETIASSGTISYAGYPLAQSIMTNLPLILSITGFVLIIIFFSKRKQGGYDV